MEQHDQGPERKCARLTENRTGDRGGSVRGGRHKKSCIKLCLLVLDLTFPGGCHLYIFLLLLERLYNFG